MGKSPNALCNYIFGGDKMISTGLLEFEGSKCVFKLKKFSLDIEVIEDRDKTFIEDLDFMFGDSKKEFSFPYFIKGKDFESGKNIFFSLRSLYQSNSKTYKGKINFYILSDYDDLNYDCIQIGSMELNSFHQISQAYSFSHSPKSGEGEVKIEPYDNSLKEFSFNYNTENISCRFSIGRFYTHLSSTPIKFQSNLNFYISNTVDFNKALELTYISKNFLNFVTYRKSVDINTITLKRLDPEKNKYFIIGNMFIEDINSEFQEEEKVVRERIIPLPLIEDGLNTLFEKFANKEIYLKHIPDSFKARSIITPSRFLMVTAGFEWQFRAIYSEETEENNNKYIKEKEEILSFLEEKIDNNTGKVKKYFKGIKSLVNRSNMTLADKICWSLKEFDNVLKIFVNHIYSLNQIEDFSYEDISERIQYERNNFAHGNLDKEFNSLAIIDFLVLEWLYYAMILKDIGISDINIQKSINDLFKRNIGF